MTERLPAKEFMEKFFTNAKIFDVKKVKGHFYKVTIKTPNGEYIETNILGDFTHTFTTMTILSFISYKDNKVYGLSDIEITIPKKSVIAALNYLAREYNMSGFEGQSDMPRNRQKRDIRHYLDSILDEMIGSEHWEYNFGRRYFDEKTKTFKQSPGTYNVNHPDFEEGIYTVKQMAKKLGVDLKTFE